MLLLIDIGNTNVTLGVYKNEKFVLTARLATETGRTADQYAIDIRDVLSLHGENYKDIEGCAISSVVPSVGDAVKRAIERLCNVTPLSLGPGVKTGLNIKIDNPAQLGADLAAGAVGAIAKYPLPCIVIDMGTATTISLIGENGEMLGGAIAAGVRLTLKALFENTAQLPSVNIEAPADIVGKNTVDCMKSGLVFGTASMIDGMIERMEASYGKPCTVVATGGLSKEIIRHCKREINYDENLLLDGLLTIYEKNIL
ncbi:MAG: type III pantothenate kinase [Ruminococcaceae bacterium]|nr:type III pantothenate kinase [Oscillospiraceae bacterium]